MFKCNYCEKEFPNKRALNAHKGIKHKDQMLDEPFVMETGDILDISCRELMERKKVHSNRCDICGKLETANTRPDCKSVPNQLCVDHDHKTNRFRGFLCVQCNRNFGWYDKYKTKIQEHENFEHL